MLADLDLPFGTNCTGALPAQVYDLPMGNDRLYRWGIVTLGLASPALVTLILFMG